MGGRRDHCTAVPTGEYPSQQGHLCKGARMWAEVRSMVIEIRIPRVVDDPAVVMVVVLHGRDLFLDRMEYLQGSLETEHHQNRQHQQGDLFSMGALEHGYQRIIGQIAPPATFLLRSSASIQRSLSVLPFEDSKNKSHFAMTSGPSSGTTSLDQAAKDNETHNCAVCQNGGQVYTGRAASRLLPSEGPSTIEEFEAIRGRPWG